MINMILKSYFALLLSVGLISLTTLILGVYWIIRSNYRRMADGDVNSVADAIANIPTKADVSAIAGDDVITTQLDLARAYIETNKKQAAKKILEMIMIEGNDSQQEEAKFLMGMI